VQTAAPWLNRLCLFAILVCLASGCGDGKVTPQQRQFSEEDWKKVKEGMSEQEVIKLLGKQDEDNKRPNQTGCTLRWKRGRKVYHVALEDDKVMNTVVDDLDKSQP